MTTPTFSIVADGASALLQWPGEPPVNLDAANLRMAARDAQSVRHRHDYGTIPVKAGLAIIGADPVGTMGLNIRFSDGCDRAIYPWAYLREIVDELSIN